MRSELDAPCLTESHKLACMYSENVLRFRVLLDGYWTFQSIPHERQNLLIQQPDFVLMHHGLIGQNWDGPRTAHGPFVPVEGVILNTFTHTPKIPHVAR